MGLAVQCQRCLDMGEWHPSSWLVYAEHLGATDSCILYGFGRKLDAEIAARVLSETQINWDGTREEIIEQYHSFGGHEKLMEFVCSRLQW